MVGVSFELIIKGKSKIFVMDKGIYKECVVIGAGITGLAVFFFIFQLNEILKKFQRLLDGSKYFLENFICISMYFYV